MQVSILHLCVIAVDRYRSITDGVSYIQRRTLNSALLTIAAIWVVTLWISSPPVLGWNSWKHSDGFEICELTEEAGYVIHSALGSLVFPLILMVVLYVKIYRAIQKRLAERSKLPTVENSGDHDIDETTDQSDQEEESVSVVPVPENDDPAITTPAGDTGSKAKVISKQIQKIMKDKIRFSLTRERRAARILFCIMSAFIGCWLPFEIMYITTPFLPVEYKPSVTVYQLVTWLGYVNSALNPIIYTIFNRDFRKGFKGVLRMQFQIKKK